MPILKLAKEVKSLKMKLKRKEEKIREMESEFRTLKNKCNILTRELETIECVLESFFSSMHKLEEKASRRET